MNTTASDIYKTARNMISNICTLHWNTHFHTNSMTSFLMFLQDHTSEYCFRSSRL